MKKLLTLVTLFIVTFVMGGCAEKQTCPTVPSCPEAPSCPVCPEPETPPVQVNPELAEIASVINGFVDKYGNEYITAEQPNYMLVAALEALNDYDDTKHDLKLSDEYLNTLKTATFTKLNDAYKANIILTAYGLSTDNVKTYVESIPADKEFRSWEYQTAYALLSKFNVNVTLQQNILENMIIVQEGDYKDADYAAGCLYAASKSEINKASLYNLINKVLSPKGLIAWGKENSATTALTVLALLSLGMDPTNYLGYNLIDMLLSFKVEDAFKINHTDASVDKNFATPQCITALTAYYIYLNTEKPVKLY